MGDLIDEIRSEGICHILQGEVVEAASDLAMFNMMAFLEFLPSDATVRDVKLLAATVVLAQRRAGVHTIKELLAIRSRTGVEG